MNENMDKLLSVIIPVYKVEKYLSRCVESIRNQTYKNLEIILVDDGSPDNCGQICDDYAQKDKRIKVIHQENKGLSGARNSGVRIANGDYIAFVDSDDWLALDAYENMLKVAKEYNADIVKCGFNYTDGHKEDNACEKVLRVIQENILNNYFQGALWIVVWNGLYKSSIAKKVIYPEGYNAEDNYATFFYLYNAKKIVMMPNVYYQYYKNNAGIRLGSNKKEWSNTKIKLMDKLMQDIDKMHLDLPDEIKERLNIVWARDLFHKIRDDKEFIYIDDKLDFIYKYLDTRRRLQLKLILLKRHLGW